ncbi:hypothetical protein [Mammaliicoccus sp. N-M52]|uniref:hypothetical protein n=1 Tax=Mammaliicoccus sp. N-M52 TaxID=2898711 RepID=UPI001EFB5C8C|nr:hypothetical protein [Mammaliicoccus sp. N-M52]
MINTISILNEIIITIIMLLVIFSFLYFMLMQKLPYSYKIDSYVYFKDLVYDAGRWIFTTFIAISVTTIIYHTVNSSFPNTTDLVNEDFSVLFIIILGIMIVFLNLSALLMFERFIKKLLFYFSLKKNNISNKLRHAIANKNETAIIENFKLVKQTNIQIELSNEDILVLLACLSKYEYYDDIKHILTPMTHSKHSIIASFLRRYPNFFEYNVKGIDETFKPSKNFKHILKNCDHTFKYLYTSILLFFGVQLFILLFFNTSINSKGIFVLLINACAIVFITLKYIILHRTYKNEIVKTNVSRQKFKIKYALIDKIIIFLSVIMIITTFVRFVF